MRSILAPIVQQLRFNSGLSSHLRSSICRGYAQARKLDASSHVSTDLQQRIEQIPPERYRNFCIVAHIDHGKSTLSDRLLEMTGVIDTSNSNKQVLDKLDVERERGITVKAQTCTMIYNYGGEDYLLNLVDTPGHVDFRHEVSRSYASCQGALLLVDASQGIQAQTVANFQLAFDLDLVMLPIINKIDLPHANPLQVTEEILDMFELEDPLEISAKSGTNVAQVLPSIVERLPPPPTANETLPLRCLLVDSWFDNYLGVVMLISVVDGQIAKGMRIMSAYTERKYEVKEVGIMHPDRKVMPKLRAGQLGYIVTGMKRSNEAQIGDTFMRSDKPRVEPLPGFEEAKPMVFMGAFPGEGTQFDRLEESMEQLTLNDRSVIVERESSNALGQGWRLGFLGTLHASVFQERLQKEHGGNLIFTAPTVPYKLVERKTGEEQIITNPDQFPQYTAGYEMQEPYVEATINCPPDFLGSVVQLCVANRGMQTDVEYLANGQVTSKFLIPLAELVDDFFGKLKGISKGYASLDYEDAGYRESHIVKLELLVNGEGVDSLARVMHASQAELRARDWVKKFRQYLRYQLFEVIIQARVGKRILARETIKAKRKDVLARLHASDISRRKKLLSKQKEGKKNMQSVGRVTIPQEAYQGFLSKD